GEWRVVSNNRKGFGRSFAIRHSPLLTTRHSRLTKSVAPAPQRRREGQGGGFIDAPRDGPCQHVGGDRTEFRQGDDRIAERPRARGGGEPAVAVERRVRRTDGRGEPVLRHDGEASGLRLGQLRIRRHYRQRGAFAQAPLGAEGERIRRQLLGKTTATEFPVAL